MTDNADKPTEEMVSSYIGATCQLLPKFSPVVSDQMHNLIPPGCAVPKKYSILCGSCAEFYIRPLNTCIADYDFLISTVDEVAFSGDFPVLPSDKSGLPETIECFKIESYQSYPGFVRLRGFGKLNYDWKYKKYEFSHTELSDQYKKLNLAISNENFLCTRFTNKSPNSVTGPAIKFHPFAVDCCLGSDFVESVWCPQWPSEAKDWHIRPRKFGWPSTDTISEVLQNGCHVVYVQHRSCRDDREQWRFSFSVAEVILLQSWTKIQQIVYHLLRYLVKRELIKKDCPKENEILCMYHIKTLMLWTCEEMSSEWWNSYSVILMCRKLLEKLSQWLKRKNCPNYFIPGANLFRESWSSIILEKTERQLNEFCSSGILCNWLLENYIWSFFRKNFKVELTMPQFMCSTRHPLKFLKENELNSLDVLFSIRFSYSHKDFRCKIKTVGGSKLSHILNLKCHTTNLHPERYLTTTQSILCFTYYDNLLHILHVAHGIGLGEFSWDSSLTFELMKEMLIQPKIIRSKYHNFPKAHKTRSTRFQFLRSQDLMQTLTGSSDSSEFQVLSLVSKEFLGKVLETSCPTCPQCKCIAPAALAYLAALHFVSSEYQQAIGLCQAVLVDQTSQKERETLNAGCLLFIDDVAKIVGLHVLNKKITDKNLRYIGRRLYLDLRLSPEVFAYYLAVLSAERISTHINFQHDLPDSLFPMDEYLKTLMKSNCIYTMKSGSAFSATREIVYRRKDSLTETVSTIVNPLTVKDAIISILMEYALENMSSFYSVFHRDFGIQCNTVNCYRALYFYKCRQYDQMLNSCNRILLEPDLPSDLQEYGFANVLVLPPLDSFFDTDVQSLLGFHTLFYYLSPLKYDTLKCNSTAISTFACFFRYKLCSRKEELSTLLDTHYSVKRNYFLGRHFLSRYLKVRYCIDCDHSYTTTLNEFVTQKTNLPFEQIIRMFLLHKLRILKK